MTTGQPTVTAAATGAPPHAPKAVERAILPYRVVAIVTGIGLVVLCAVGLPLKYVAGSNAVVAVVGPIHGFLYIAYLLLALHLAVKMRWHPVFALLVMAAGTIPFMGFVAEHLVTRKVRQRAASMAAAV